MAKKSIPFGLNGKIGGAQKPKRQSCMPLDSLVNGPSEHRYEEACVRPQGGLALLALVVVQIHSRNPKGSK